MYNIDKNEEDFYEPSDEELREMEELLRQEEELDTALSDSSMQNTSWHNFINRKNDPLNRVFYTFNSESHFIGWLRVNGIIWPKEKTN